MTPLLGEQREPALGRPRRAGIRCLALGAAFGALASLLKISPPPYGEVGGKVVDASWRWVLPVPEFASLLLGVGWAWAGLAVAAGWLAGTRARGAAAGVLALIAATATYYCMRSVLRREAEMLRWWLASVLLGAALGAVGASIRPPHSPSVQSPPGTTPCGDAG